MRTALLGRDESTEWFRVCSPSEHTRAFCGMVAFPLLCTAIIADVGLALGGVIFSGLAFAGTCRLSPALLGVTIGSAVCCIFPLPYACFGGDDVPFPKGKAAFYTLLVTTSFAVVEVAALIFYAVNCS